MTRIFLARHGEPQKSLDVAQGNWPLSRFGQSQAEQLAEELAVFAPLNIVSSPALRCKESAEFAAKRLGRPVKIDSRLGEITPPRGEDPQAWLDKIFFQTDSHWGQLDAGLRKWRSDTIDAIKSLKDDTVVFTQHTNINAIMAAALGLENTMVCRPDYASMTEFSVVNGDIRLVMSGTEIKGPNE